MKQDITTIWKARMRFISIFMVILSAYQMTSTLKGKETDFRKDALEENLESSFKVEKAPLFISVHIMCKI